MKMAVLRMADDEKDIYVNPEMVICVFPTEEDSGTGGTIASKTHTSVMLVGNTIIRVIGGLERVVGILRAAR